MSRYKMAVEDTQLMAHLMRRAGFGATRDELEARLAVGYEATVEELLNTDAQEGIEDDLLRRYYPDHSGGLGLGGVRANWLHRMIVTNGPLQEKIALFWHGVFATGYSKVVQGRALMDQVTTFRRYGMGSLRTLLVELSGNPAMIMWLDNHDNHKGAINENYGRELLELFSMGVGNYTEQDIKECARAFTGWTIGNTKYMEMRARNDSLWPYGRLNWHFEYRPEDHDDGEITFLGQKGRFNGEDVVDIICQQPATARFISRHLYSFFVADEPPVPQWPYKPPIDPEAIQTLSQAYFDGGYDIRYMLRVLFNSAFFRSEDSWYQKVKSPAELVTGVLRLTGEHQTQQPKLQQDTNQMDYMGQTLVNPPSVEGWHQGTEWIDSGALVERVNYAAQQFEDVNKPGVKTMIEGLLADGGGVISPERLVDGCLEQMGAFTVSQESRSALIELAAKGGELQPSTDGPDVQAQRRVAEMLRMVAATPDFQRA